MGFGDFEHLCSEAAIPLCSEVGPITSVAGSHGIEANCYARNIELANTIIFQGASSFIHIGSLIMTVIMILHVRSKFTAVGEYSPPSVSAQATPSLNAAPVLMFLKIGRKEITSFFYIFMGLSFISLCLDAGVIPPGSSTFPYFAAVQNGLTSALCMCLLINGFVGFQLYEDGTPLSVWLLRGVSFVFFIITGLVSLATFKSWAGLGPTKTLGMFVMLYLVNGIALLVYVIMQVILVVNTLQDRWPLGDIAFGVFFLIIGQVILYVFSTTICNAVQHYLDGLFFATICNLLAIMMVYKYWDSITREDLEFSVGIKQNNWEVKELLPEDDRRTTVYQDTEYSAPGYTHSDRVRTSNYGGFGGY
ncbi:hypothetical protein B7463_g4661, partial [Scytalidium lignicola]